jgi:hypothetical protein
MMNKIYKTIITFALSTLTPTLVWIVVTPLILVGMVALDPTGLGPENINLLTKIARFIFAMMIFYFWWGLFMGVFVFILSSMHMLFLGIMTFLIAYGLKLIRWYTVLPAAFFIGGAPYILFMWGSSLKVWIGVPLTMGLFGLSAGMVFWLLWRFWVSPENYTKQAIFTPNQNAILN